MNYFLGIDGGQSSTTALIGDETGRVIGAGRAGPCNHATAAEGRERFTRALTESTRRACEDARLDHEIAFESACMGFSGGPADKDSRAREIVRARQYSITHDAMIALVGATAGEPGVVVIAGTGSMAFGRNPAHKAARAGGWGYVFGDEGSAFDIVRKVLRASLRFEEGWGPSTAAHAALLTALAARDANDVLHRFYSDDYPRSRVAAFAGMVDELARSGDQVARDVLNEAAVALATIAAAVRQQLFPPGHIVTIAYAGGVFHSALLLERFRMLVEMHDGNRVAAPRYGPAAGALLEAYRLAGLNPALRDLPAE